MDVLESVVGGEGAVRADPPSVPRETRWSVWAHLSILRWQLAAALVVLNLLDVVTTHVVLERGGSEQNPVMEPFVDSLWQGATIKVVLLAAVLALLARCDPRSRRIDAVLGLVTAWYVFVVGWNLGIISQLPA